MTTWLKLHASWHGWRYRRAISAAHEHGLLEVEYLARDHNRQIDRELERAAP